MNGGDLIHSQSGEGAISEFDLFSVPLTNTQIDKAGFVYYHPIAPVKDAEIIEFVVPGAGEDYMDLSKTTLELVGQFVQAGDNAVLLAADIYAPVNNFIHSLFSQVDVMLNDTQVSKGSPNYPYKAYLEKLLNYGLDAKENTLSSAFWYTDTSGKFDVLTDDNKGFKKRKEMTTASKTFELIDKLHIDIFNTTKFLVSNVALKIKLTRSKNTFYTMRPNGTVAVPAKDIKFNILSAVMKVRKIKPTNAVLLSHAQRMLNGANAQYPINFSEIKTFSISAGTQSHMMDNVFLGRIPSRIIIGMVKDTSVNGAYLQNPFNFAHNDLNYLAIYYNGVQIPTRAYQPNFAADLSLPCYHDFLECSGKWGGNETNFISREAYNNGNTLFIFDLTPGLDAASDRLNLVKQGSIRIDMKFNVALPNNIIVMVYGESEQIMQIDSNRDVALDFTV